MSVLFDINHPAHVHYFKQVITDLKKAGREVTVVARDKDVTLDLLKAYSIPFLDRGRGGNNYFSRSYYHIKAIWFNFKVIKEKGVKSVVSFMHPYGAQAAYFSGVRRIAFTDTENAKLHHLFTVPFLDKVYSPEYFKLDFGSKHERFPGFMEFAYLHPKYFKPEKNIRKTLNIECNEPYCVLRFVSRKSLHDQSHPGLSDPQKIDLVHKLKERINVFITSEVKLPNVLRKYELQNVSSKMHSVLKEAHLFIGESATMASEAAILGVPSIYIDNIGRGYTDLLEMEYKLLKRFEETEDGFQNALDLSQKFLKSEQTFFDDRKAVNIEFDLPAYMFKVIGDTLK